MEGAGRPPVGAAWGIPATPALLVNVVPVEPSTGFMGGMEGVGRPPVGAGWGIPATPALLVDVDAVEPDPPALSERDVE
jgi:hypothetical protein